MWTRWKTVEGDNRLSFQRYRGVNSFWTDELCSDHVEFFEEWRDIDQQLAEASIRFGQKDYAPTMLILVSVSLCLGRMTEHRLAISRNVNPSRWIEILWSYSDSLSTKSECVQRGGAESCPKEPGHWPAISWGVNPKWTQWKQSR